MKNKGFTLLELLVVIAILAILAVVGMGQYRTSQIKARDGQRKSDLSNIARALEMYYNDFGQYPVDDDDGQMVVGGSPLNWGEETFETDDAIYMKILPQDPKASNDSNGDYCYMSNGGADFLLYAKLENENDKDYFEDASGNHYSTVCGNDYTYVITSSNIAEPT